MRASDLHEQSASSGKLRRQIAVEFKAEIIRRYPGSIAEWPAIVVENDPPSSANKMPPLGDVFPNRFYRMITVDMQERDLAGVPGSAKVLGCEAVCAGVKGRGVTRARARIIHQALERRQVHAERFEYLIHGRVIEDRVHGGNFLVQFFGTPRIDA
jgi:hypothetical protein